MYCSNCGGQVPDDVRFCGSCGKEVTPATAIESTDQSSAATDTSEHNARFETIGNQPTIDRLIQDKHRLPLPLRSRKGSCSQTDMRFGEFLVGEGWVPFMKRLTESCKTQSR